MFTSFRLQLVCLFLLALTLVSASTGPSTHVEEATFMLDDGTTYTPAVHKLMTRQSGQTTLCFPLTINLVQNGVTTGVIRQRTCYCNYQGTLTTATQNDMNAAFASTSTAINQTNYLSYQSSNRFTPAQALANIKSSVQSALNTKTTTCIYGSGAVPDSCDACTFTCANSGTKKCGTTCIASTATCASGLPQKRDIERKRCTLGWEICATGISGKLSGWECVNTQSDLESCGGCQQPLQGRNAGVDCTAIVGIDGVACVSGLCKINSCLRGYKLENNACVPVTRSASSAAALSSKAIAAKRTAAAASVAPGAQSAQGKKDTGRGQHKDWNKREKKPTKNQRRR